MVTMATVDTTAPIHIPKAAFFSEMYGVWLMT
jgi:hypothetical protein